MTRIDFYILDNDDADKRNATVCRLVEKAWRQSNHVYIHTQSKEQTKELDDLLWTFRAESFVPHSCMEPNADIPEKAPRQVLLGHHFEPDASFDVMINLGETVPDFFSRFKRVLEVVNQEDEVRQKGRQRYTYYRDRGYPMHHHTLS